MPACPVCTIQVRFWTGGGLGFRVHGGGSGAVSCAKCTARVGVRAHYQHGLSNGGQTLISAQWPTCLNGRVQRLFRQQVPMRTFRSGSLRSILHQPVCLYPRAHLWLRWHRVVFMLPCNGIEFRLIHIYKYYRQMDSRHWNGASKQETKKTF